MAGIPVIMLSEITTFLVSRCAAYYEFTNPITDKVNIMTQQTHTNRGTAVVTGASTGMGALYAAAARMGYDLIIVARNHNRLNQLAEHITTDSGRSVEVITADSPMPHS